MKVVRVTNEYHKNPHAPIIEVGDEVNVVAQGRALGELMYRVAERPPVFIDGCKYNIWYDAKGFAILPDTTEEVEAEHQHEAIIYQR